MTLTKSKGSTFNLADQKLLTSSIDHGGKSDGITDDTAAINAALAAASNGVVFIPANTVFTEASLVIPVTSVILDFSQPARIRILHAAVAANGIEIKAQGKTGTYLAADQVDVNNPLLKILSSLDNTLAILSTKRIITSRDTGAQVSLESSLGAERITFNLENLAVGSTADLACYVDNNSDGIAELLAFYIARVGTEPLKFVLAAALGVKTYADITEMTAPAAPPANTARLYCVDNGAGKTQLAVLFPTGVAQILATEP